MDFRYFKGFNLKILLYIGFIKKLEFFIKLEVSECISLTQTLQKTKKHINQEICRLEHRHDKNFDY